ncbi:hypothetical protein KAU11_02880, partial [Candidatus Babeliales bacterium]|nr:hypothetical protein [Candidatus Babeliales bacterium]
SVDVMSGLNDESARVARVIFNLPGMAVVRFIHSQKEETPSLRDDSASLPVDLKGKIGLYQVNAAKCMDLLKIIAFRVRLTKLDLPAVMFFNGSSLSLPIERGDISLQPLFELIRGRVMCRVH